MEKYYGNYLGLCINNNDPEKRGRVQIFVPHIMPALYDGWNKDGKDIDITCVGDNISNALTSEQIEKLKAILPWAEAASPIMGSSSPGGLISQAVNKVAGAVAGAVNAASHYLFDQSPVAQPSSAAPSQGLSDIFARAGAIGRNGVSANNFLRNSSGDGNCGFGVEALIGARTNDVAKFSQPLGGNANSFSTSGGNNFFEKSGYYNAGTPLPASYTPKDGDIVAANGGGRGLGHIQTYIVDKTTGEGAWYSDFKQNGILSQSHGVPYTDFALYTPNDAGKAAMGISDQATPSQQSTGVPTDTTVAGYTAVANVHATPDPTAANAKVDITYGSVADPTVQNNSSGGTSSSYAPNQSFILGQSSRKSIAANAALLNASMTGSISQTNGVMDQSSMLAYATQRYQNSPLTKTPIPDAAKWGFTPDSNGLVSADQWAKWSANVANNEYGGRINRSGDPDMTGDPGGSNGPWSSSVADATNYANKSVTADQLNSDPTLAMNVFASQVECEVIAGGGIGALSHDNPTNAFPQGGSFAPNTLNRAALSGGLQSFAASGGKGSLNNTQKTALVQNTSPYGAVATQPLNNTAKGVFTYPSAGAMLWLFFREGNPLFPVYFAASYSSDEWKSATRHGSNGPIMTPPGADPSGLTSTGGIMNLNGVGGLRWEDTKHPTDPTKSQKSMMFFGEDGSNMFMGKGYHQIFSKFDRRDQVEGDRWNTTLGHKEEWIQGDSNHVTMGDVFIKIGNVSQPAVDAVTRIQQLIKEGHKPLTDLK